MSIEEFKKYRELEKQVETRRKQLMSIVPLESDMIEASKFIAQKLKQEFPEWFVPTPAQEVKE